jgi:hypothetical protein
MVTAKSVLALTVAEGLCWVEVNPAGVETQLYVNADDEPVIDTLSIDQYQSQVAKYLKRT